MGSKISKSTLRSQTRLRYIADRVLQSSSDMFQKNKDDAWLGGEKLDMRGA